MNLRMDYWNKTSFRCKVWCFHGVPILFSIVKKLKKTPASEIINKELECKFQKIEILTRGYVKYQLNLI